ncbi:PspC domain-containing protein [Psychroserpens sp. NJDZ02]|uniref:PspC domain-containing protein n=1 Tax=Psychroserpens sp. NJDZ02 TaxID=2570561 RepID=UPI0010A7BF62|nr:PspC domain-containing protein [Psychroserpens sp. NJDZ02]QCE42122.1 PspC domain-containing protein [Psychroserpens sp. NJDZ02]
MNKTVNINLAGIFFHIDEDAYLKLQRYLEAIKRSFTDSQGRSEIIADIEIRIAELFSERMKTDRQVISNTEVDDVITIMGQPEDYLVDDEIFEDEPEHKSYSKSSSYSKSKNVNSKKLFRDTENSYVGGVCSGLAHYFNIEVIWVRLIWVLLIFGAGTGVFLYILLWVFIPEATSTADKLTMTGEEVTITNIEKKIRDGFDSVTENVKNIDFQKHADKFKEGFEQASDSFSESVKKIDTNKIKSSSQSFFESLGGVISSLLKIVSKFIGIALVVSCVAGIIALAIGLIFGTFFDADFTFFTSDFVRTYDGTDGLFWLFPVLIFIVSVIPIIFFIYLGLKILIKNLKPMGSVAKYSLIGLWIMAVIGLAIVGTKQGLSYKEQASDIKTQQLTNIKTNDTLVLSMNYNDTFAERFIRDFGLQHTNDDNGNDVVFSQGIRLIVKSTKDNVAKLRVKKSARGINFDKAKNRAKNINYNYTLVDNNLILDNYFTVPKNEISRDQEIELTLYLPEGSILYAEESTYNYHKNNTHYYNDILNNGMEEQHLLVKHAKLECLDCDTDNNEENNNKQSNTTTQDDAIIVVNEDGLVAKTKNLDVIINDEGAKASTENVKVTINEDDGINITSNKDNK